MFGRDGLPAPALPAKPGDAFHYWRVVNFSETLKTIRPNSITLNRTILYERPAVANFELKFAPGSQDKVLVVGSPGVGKSMTVFLRACQMRDRDVFIVRTQKKSFGLCLHILDGEIKSAYDFSSSANGDMVGRALRSLAPHALIVFDGAEADIMDTIWNAQGPWVAVCSPAVTRPGEYQVDVDLRLVDSWLLTEFVDAVANCADFRRQVWAKLGSTPPLSVDQPTSAWHVAMAISENATIASERGQSQRVLTLLNSVAHIPEADLQVARSLIEVVVAAKEFYCGGSCRWMFDLDPMKAAGEIHEQLQRIHDAKGHITSGMGEQTSIAVHHLQRRHGDARVLVSQYVQRYLTHRADRAFMKGTLNVVAACGNAAFLEHL